MDSNTRGAEAKAASASPGHPRLQRAAAPSLPRATRRFHRFPHVRQLDETDCGAACLAMVSRYYGRRPSVGVLRDLASVGHYGASLHSLAAAAEHLGYTTRALRATPQQLHGLEFPLIAHWQGSHFVVVYAIGKKHVVIGDPAIGIIRLSHQEFADGWTGFLLTLVPTPQLKQIQPVKTTFLRFLPYVTPYRRLLVEIFLASVMLELFSLVTPVFTQVVVDRVLVHQNVSMLNLMLVGMLFVGVFQTVITLLRDYFTAHLAQKLRLRFSADLLRQMLRLPLRFFDTRRIGDVMQRFEDNDEIQDVLTGKAISTILDLVTMVLTIALMFFYSVQLTMIALIAIPMYAALTLAFTPALKRNNLQAVEQSVASNSHLIDLFKSIPTVKSYAAEDPARWRQEDHFVREANVNYRDAILGMSLTGLSSTIDVFARLVLFWYGAHLVIQGQLTLGQLVAFQTLVAMALGPVMGLIGLWDDLQEANLSLQRLADVHNFEPEQPLGASAIRLPRLRGGIELEHVSFRYNADSPNILSDINLRIDPGSVVAIVGRSGSGKTTLINLIQRFYLPSDGRIRIDDFDLAAADIRSLRSQLGVVPQSPTLFSGTIRTNIAFADPDAPLAQVMEAARVAGAHEFIVSLPLGYETVVGDAGIRLSGGQIQRLAIARALLRDPRILIFDEATSALDTQSEQSLQRNMAEILRDRTTILIAHRLSTVKDADRIVVMEQGKIAEQGTHRELMEKQGLYHLLASQQMTF